jgi:hypothetical protein
MPDQHSTLLCSKISKMPTFPATAVHVVKQVSLVGVMSMSEPLQKVGAV